MNKQELQKIVKKIIEESNKPSTAFHLNSYNTLVSNK